MKNKHDNELEVPEQILDDPDAKEYLRVWVCGNGEVVINSHRNVEKPEGLDDLMLLIACNVALNDLLSIHNHSR